VTAALQLFCPAKLNLHLRVLGRRQDGYHLLETLFHAVDLGDELCARRGGGVPLSVTADDARDRVGHGDDNLVLRAKAAFVAATGRGDDVCFRLHKRIPPGGGLGGGSSDAAAALRLCNELCSRPLDDPALHALARGLGADVPFFLHGGSQWGRGVGDELERAVDVGSYHVTLLVPPFGCATADVYKNFSAHWNETFDAARVRRARDSHHNDLASGGPFVNDLTAAAERVQPGLVRVRQQAEALGVSGVAMTGSGSTLFVCAGTAVAAAEHRRLLQPLQADGVRILAARSAPGPFAPRASAWPGGGA
jgi:4-diphosphocytidyl-2-C-methyl-D-erythritol kinase